MRRIVFALMSTVTAVVMLFGYRTSTGASVTPSSPVAVAAGGTDGTTSSGTTATVPAPASSPDSTSTTRSVTGDTMSTRWGPVQVQITVSGRQITAVTAVQVPSGNRRDAEINSYAVPVLNSEALQAQSASIDSVSGATVTSGGYIDSLQSAIDRAGL